MDGCSVQCQPLPFVRPSASVPSFQIEWRDDILENGTTNSASFEFDHRARSIVNPSMSYLAPRPLKRMPKWIARARSVRLVAQCPLFSEGEVLLQYYRNCHLCPSDFVNVNLMGTVSIGQYNILFLARNDVQAASRPNSKDSWRQNLAVGDRAESAPLYLRRISYLAFGLPTDFS